MKKVYAELRDKDTPNGSCLKIPSLLRNLLTISKEGKGKEGVIHLVMPKKLEGPGVF